MCYKTSYSGIIIIIGQIKNTIRDNVQRSVEMYLFRINIVNHFDFFYFKFFCCDITLFICLYIQLSIL